MFTRDTPYVEGKLERHHSTGFLGVFLTEETTKTLTIRDD